VWHGTNFRYIRIKARTFQHEELKYLILDPHEGRDFNEVKSKFESKFGKVSSREISDMERELISEGMGVEIIQKL
jgi:hypothetical protein